MKAVDELRQLTDMAVATYLGCAFRNQLKAMSKESLEMVMNAFKEDEDFCLYVESVLSWKED